MKKQLLLITLVLLSAINIYSQGSQCSDPLDATADANNEHTLGQATSEWYSFTATQDGKIVLQNLAEDANSYVEVYTDCITYYNGGSESLSFESYAGQTYLIKWYNYNSTNFYWSLSEESYTPGEICTVPIETSLGENSADNSNGAQWFSYTTTQDCILTISTVGLTSEDTYLYVYSDCVSDYLYKSDDEVNEQSEIEFYAEANTTFLIKWDDEYTSSSYTWNISEETVTPGKLCSVAIEANIGENNTDNSNGAQWFSYTTTQECVLRVSSIGLTTEDTYLYIYSDCSSNYEYKSDDEFSYQSEVLFYASANTTYYIKWDDEYTSSSFNWTISEESGTNGQFCSSPITATADSNNEHSFGQYRMQWYSYTATMNGKIVLENLAEDADSYVMIYTDCETSYASGAESSVFQCTEGQTYYIQWYNKNSTNFNWSLSEEDLVEGDACSLPLLATADSNNEHTLGQYSNQWFYYTATQDGKIVLQNLATDADSYVVIYTDCNTYYEEGDESLSFACQEGQTYYIRWYNYNSTNFNWSLSEEDYLPGEFCSNPILATADSNNEHTFGQYEEHWYYYTATKSGRIELQNLATDADSYVLVYTDCNTYYAEGNESLSFICEEGQIYYIIWFNYTSNNFYWSLNETDYLAGEDCSAAITASLGENTADNSSGSQWFEYTPTVDATVTISSCDLTSADTYVYLYTDCGASEVYKSDDNCSYQSELSFEAQANTTYYIKWSNTFTSSSYTWTITTDVTTDIDSRESIISDVKLYPNPATDNISIESDKIIDYIQIFNSQGNMVKEVECPETKINLDLTQGLYLVNIYFKDGSSAIKKLTVK